MKRIVILLILLFFFTSCVQTPTPENCAFCAANIHSAGLINLQTGEIFIIEITGRKDTMSLINTAGLTGWMSGELHISLAEGRGINRAHFCESCRKELENAGDYSHALFDAGRQVMPLTDAADITLSGFAVKARGKTLVITAV